MNPKLNEFTDPALKGVKKALSILMITLIMGIQAAVTTGCGGGGGGAAVNTLPQPPGPNTSGLTVNPSTGNAPMTVTAALCVVGASPAITGALMSWGDNRPATPIVFNSSGCWVHTAQTPTQHTYATSGSFTLTATTPGYPNQTATVQVNGQANQPGNTAPVISSSGSIDCSPNPLAINSDMVCRVTASDANNEAVACNFDFGDGTVKLNQTCSAANRNAYRIPGVYMLMVTPVDARGLLGTPVSIPVTVNASSAGAPTAPSITTANIPGLSGSVNADRITISGNKGNDCTKLFSTHSTTPIVTTNSTQWTYTFPLTVEGGTTFGVFCRNDIGESSDAASFTGYRKMERPLPPTVNTPPASAQGLINLSGRKPRDCNLWIQGPVGTAQMVDDQDSYTTLTKNQTVPWSSQVTLANNTGAQTINLYCEDDVLPTALRSDTVPVIVNGTGNGGGGNNTATAVTGTLNVTVIGGIASAALTCNANSSTNTTGTLTWTGTINQTQTPGCVNTTLTQNVPNGNFSVAWAVSGSGGGNTYNVTNCNVVNGSANCSATGGGNGNYTLNTSITAAFDDFDKSNTDIIGIKMGVPATECPTLWCIYTITAGSTTVTRETPVNIPQSVGNIRNIAVCPANGRMGAYDSGLNKVWLLSTATKSHVGSFDVPGLGGTVKMVCDNAGNFIFTDTGSNQIKKFSPTGTLAWTYTGVTNPADAAVDGQDNVYIADRGNQHRVVKIDSAGVFVTSWNTGIGNPFSSLSSIDVNAANQVFVVDGSRVQQSTAAGIYIDQFTQNHGASRIKVIGSNGNGGRAYFSDNTTVYRYQ